MTLEEFNIIAKHSSTKGCPIPDDYRDRSAYYSTALKEPLKELALKHGYLLNYGGTGIRDLDVLCVPWLKEFSHPTILAEEIKALTTKLVGHAIMRPGEDTLTETSACNWVYSGSTSIEVQEYDISTGDVTTLGGSLEVQFSLLTMTMPR